MENGVDKTLVILADDDDDDKILFKMALTRTNVQSDVITVNNGKQLTDYLKKEPPVNPCIIFLDINMPIKNGLECLEEIKANKKLADIPVIMYSTSDHDGDVSTAFKGGANLYLMKPSHFPVLIKLLAQIFALNSKGALAKPTRNTFVLSEKSIFLRDV